MIGLLNVCRRPTLDIEMGPHTLLAAAAIGIVIGFLGGLLGKGGSAIATPLMLLAMFAMGVHSTFFGPIKYAILPQHLEHDEVLGGTGLVEAGTYIAILGGL